MVKLYADQVDDTGLQTLRTGSLEALFALFRAAASPSRSATRLAALDVLYVLLEPGVRAYARRRGHQRDHDLDDVVQSVFDIERLASDASRLPAGEPCNVAAWFLGRTRFKSGEAYRSSRRIGAHETGDSASDDGASLLEQLDTVLGDGQDLLEQLILRDEARRVEEALQSMGPPEADMIVLYYRDGLSWKEVGAQLGISPDSCKQRASVARRKLRELLDRRLHVV